MHTRTALPEPALEFLRERHLATLTTFRPDGSPHVVPVGFAYDPGEHLVRIITRADSRKVAHLGGPDGPGGPAAVCQVDGGRWLTLEGHAVATRDPERIAAAVAAYGARYQPPRPGIDRVALEIAVHHVMGRS